MEQLDKVKSIRKVRMKSGAKYLFVFRYDYPVSKDLFEKIELNMKRIGKKFDVQIEPIILQNMTLDIVEKEEVPSKSREKSLRTVTPFPGVGDNIKKV